jgi:5-methylcytosine-specific restriction protein A
LSERIENFNILFVKENKASNLMEISENQIKGCYKIAKMVFAGRMAKTEGAKRLNENGMNLASASDYIENFKKLMQGALFQRTMSAFATDYYFSKIYVDFGIEFLAKAVAAVEQHIKYYEGLRHVTLHKLRDIVENHKLLFEAPKNFEKQNAAFLEKVKESLNDSSERRRKRLKESKKQPARILTTTVTFLRNPDVVAEVLLRAKGTCERCSRKAPFIKKKDNSPYLEVHHSHLLADGGEDTIENALALCPNCHRELHFGI